MLALVWIFAGVTLLQVLIWSLFPARLVWSGKAGKQVIRTAKKDWPNVTVVICARNEAENLKKFLPEILTQQYPVDWEVLLIDDDSDDETQAVLGAMSERFSHLRVLRLSPKLHEGKKHGLATGIPMTRYDWIVLTDADCLPAGPEWLSTMMYKAEKPSVILGYAPLMASRGWLNRWARFETLYTALQYLSTARTGWPFMGVGRNLVWHKSLFLQSGGFTGHDHIPGGDDDLFINAVANRHNTLICTDQKAYISSSAKTTLNDWIRQKKRHLNAGIGYKTWHNLVLGGVAFTHAVHYGLAVILLLAAPVYWPVVLVGYLLRLSVVWPIINRACRIFAEKEIALFFPVLDGFMAIWLGGVAPFMLIMPDKKVVWK